MRPLAFIIVITILLFSNCSIPTTPPKTENKDSTHIGPVFYKPNIYLYPEQMMNVTLTIKFPNGGYLMQTIPQYQNGWDITIDTTGLINNRYHFLFYEGRAPDRYQYQAGWVIAGDSLSTFFRHNLKTSGFSRPEIEDFITYWIPLLNPDTSYAIYPQYRKNLESIIHLSFSIPPDNLRRVFYVICECPPTFQIKQKPIIPALKREAFCVLEWGVVLSEKITLTDKFSRKHLNHDL